MQELQSAQFGLGIREALIKCEAVQSAKEMGRKTEYKK
jgi:hypothetical protein